MSDLDRIRQELKSEESTLAAMPLAAEDPELDAEIAAAFERIEPTDAYIDAVFAMGAGVYPMAPSPSVTAVIEAARGAVPAIQLASLRDAHGLSKDAAARILDISPPALDRLESRIGLGWLNVAADKVRAYLERLDLNPALFVRSIATQIPQAPSAVYGYRPREIPEEALTVEGSEDDLSRLVAWSHELYK